MVAELCADASARTSGNLSQPTATVPVASNPKAAGPHRSPCTPNANPAITDWRGFHDGLRRAAQAASQTGAPLSLLMLEWIAIDDGRAPKETWQVELANAIAGEIDARTVVARYAEARLALIMGETSLDQAFNRAHRIGQRIGDRRRLPATAAIGIAQFRDDESLGLLIERVADALDRGKAAGQLITVADHRRLRRRAAPLSDCGQLCPCGLYPDACRCALT